ncbi:MAG: YidB family protein [Gammaproteobacteria bacterium]|nr:YidB family protein [Gammaproteobacteria bacterium]
MALLDILTGRSDSSSRVPPIARGIAELLAYGKTHPQNGPGDKAGHTEQLEDFFKPSPTGGPTAKGVIGALLTGGMMDLVQQFRGAGRSDAVDSWVAPGENREVSPDDLSQVLTEQQIAFLMTRTGLSRQELLKGLSDQLPQVVDRLTPDGRLPTTEEMQRRV